MPQPSWVDEVVEQVSFRAGSAELQGELVYPEIGCPRGKVILAGPHPLLGGTMSNNVVRALGDGLAQRGLVCLRFAYRGTGSRSVGMKQLAEFWRTSRCPAEREYQEDLHAAVSFLDDAAGYGLPLALVGYSFGCTLLPAASRAADALVLIAPTVGTHDLGAFADHSQPLLVIAPREDFAVDETQLAEWFDRLRLPSRLVRPKLDGHFFRGHEAWLTETVGDYLDLHLGLGRPDA
jgi:alpha/beta superfamily hydrolase